MHDIERFIDGFQSFQRRHFEDQSSPERKTHEAASPTTLVIGCCDARVEPATLLGCDPGEIFNIRDMANLVPSYGGSNGHQGVPAALQFAVTQLKVKRIIVLGHSGCGGIRAIMDGQFSSAGGTDFLGRWANIADPAKYGVRQKLGSADRAEQYRACELAAILVSLKNLESFPWIAERMAQGELTLHGWYFDMEAGALLAYTPGSDTFEPLVGPLAAQPA
ncbi:MAG: carbonic anhydrase [Rhodocyclaceae bacterium]|nr:carbonic anhydrase [Rhodocyclaceae bacterium]